MSNNRIYIFDIDDTLIDTQAKVRVLSRSGEILERLGTQFHNSHIYEENANLDFSEFEDLDQLLSEKDLPAMGCLEWCLENDPDHTFILTARQCKDVIFKWLQMKGLENIRYNNIICAGTFNTMAMAKACHTKKMIIKNLEPVHTCEKESEYPMIFLWEDDVNNIRAIREQADRMPLGIRTRINISLTTLKKY